MSGLPCCLLTHTIRWATGLHSAPPSSAGSLVMACTSVPSGFMTYTSLLPSTVCANATCAQSGANVGPLWSMSAGRDARRVRAVAFMTKIWVTFAFGGREVFVETSAQVNAGGGSVPVVGLVEGPVDAPVVAPLVGPVVAPVAPVGPPVVPVVAPVVWAAPVCTGPGFPPWNNANAIPPATTTVPTTAAIATSRPRSGDLRAPPGPSGGGGGGGGAAGPLPTGGGAATVVSG